MQDRLELRDLAVLRRLLGQTLVLVAMAGSFGLEIGAGLLTAGSMLLAILAFPLSAKIESLPAWLWRVAPIGLLLVIVGDFLLSGGDILPSLFRMIVLLTAFRALQIRTPREDYQLILLTLFLLIGTGVLSQEVTFAFQLIAYAPLSLGLLFVLNLVHQEALPGQAARVQTEPRLQGVTLSVVLRRIWRRADLRTLLAGLLLCLGTSAMAFALFVLMPRFDIGASLPFPRLMTGRSLSGFSDSVQYGDVVSILNDETIAMRVDFGEADLPARPYWRMVALDAYHAGGFKVSPRVATVRTRLQDYRFSFPAPPEPAMEEPVTLYLEGGISAYLPTADACRTLLLRNRSVLFRHDLTHVLKAPETNASTLSLRYEGASFAGRIPASDGDTLLASLQTLPADTGDTAYLRQIAYPQTLLVVPGDNTSQRILDQLVEASGYQAGMPAERFALNLIQALQSGRGYSLETRIPEGRADPLVRWIESGLDGHCELYAGAFVLAARQAGYPARLVTGFLGGDWNGFENYFMVRNRHAHAWCEIFDSSKGWLRVDPTPGSGAGLATDSLDATRLRERDRTWMARIDSLRILWFRRVIQFDAQDQAELAGSVSRLGQVSWEQLRDRLKAVVAVFRADVRAWVQDGSPAGLLQHALPVMCGLALVGFAVYSVRRWRWRVGREERLRRLAGRVLRRQRSLGCQEDSTALQVRYGPVEAWPDDTDEQLRNLLRSGPRA